MRTTITISDELYREAKALAATVGQPVGSVIEDALRELLARRSESASSAADLPVLSIGLLPDVDYADNSALLDLMDEAGDR